MKPPLTRFARILRTTGVVGVTGAFWLVLLPNWSREPRMQAALRTHAARGINASATYYTDNPAALSALRSIQQLNHDQPTLLWRPFDGTQTMP